MAMIVYMRKRVLSELGVGTVRVKVIMTHDPRSTAR